MAKTERSPLKSVLLPQLLKFRAPLLALLFLQVIAALTTLLLPNLNGRIVDEGIAKADIDAVLTIGMIMCALAFTNLVVSVLATVIGSRISTSIGRNLRNATFSQVQKFSDTDIRQFGVPSLITRSTNDINQLQVAVFVVMTVLATAPVLVIGGSVMAMSENTRLAPLVLILAVLLLAVVISIVRKLIPSFTRLQQAVDKVGRVMREQLTGIKVIRAFGRETVEQDRFDAANTDLTATAHRIGALQAMMLPSVVLIANLGAAAVIGAGAILIDNNAMQVGQIIAFVGYLTQILLGLSVGATLIALVPRAQVSARRVGEVLGTVPSVTDTTDALIPTSRRGAVRLEQVHFRFPGAERDILSDITLDCAPGSTTAILGGTGDGKTTLLNLIPRFCDVTSGRVVVDDVDVRDRVRADLYRDISYVAQVPALLSGRLDSNLRLGNPDASDAEVWAALEVACATHFVTAHEQGLEQPVQHGGKNFSGGQRQRLSLAQALIARPTLLLLDDPFSALDFETENTIKHRLRQAFPDTTIILTAQRVSSTAGADTIIVVADGRIVGRGTHSELTDSNETYREILDSQAILR